MEVIERDGTLLGVDRSRWIQLGNHGEEDLGLSAGFLQASS